MGIHFLLDKTLLTAIIYLTIKIYFFVFYSVALLRDFIIINYSKSSFDKLIILKNKNLDNSLYKGISNKKFCCNNFTFIYKRFTF